MLFRSREKSLASFSVVGSSVVERVTAEFGAGLMEHAVERSVKVASFSISDRVLII